MRKEVMIFVLLILYLPLKAQYSTVWSYMPPDSTVPHFLKVDDSENIYYTDYIDSVGYTIVKISPPSQNLLWIDTLNIHHKVYLDVGKNSTFYTASQLTTNNWVVGAYNSLGNVLWSDTFDTYDSSRVTGIMVDSSSNVFVSGIVDDSIVKAVEYNASGYIVGKRDIPCGCFTAIRTLAFDDSGNIYIGGEHYNADSTHRAYELLTSKYDISGRLLWSVSTLQWPIVKVDHDFNVYVAHDSGYEVVVKKYNRSGKLLWTTNIGDTSNWLWESIWDMAVDDSNNVYLATVWPGVLPSTFYTSIYKLNPQGNTVWSGDNQSGYTTLPHGIAVDKYSNFFVSLCVEPQYHGSVCYGLVVEYAPLGEIGNDIHKPGGLMLNVPTISKGHISFICNIPNPGNYEIGLYTVEGRRIKVIKGEGACSNRMDIHDLRNGIYVLRLKQGNNTVVRKVVLEK